MQVVTSINNSPRLYPTLLENKYLLETPSIQSRKTFISLLPVSTFRAEISLENLSLPEQRFSFLQKDNCIIFQNHPINSFPNIEIVLEKKKTKVEIKDFKVERSDNSVQGELLYTRIFLMLSEIKKCSVYIKNIGFPPFNFSFAELPTEEKNNMLRRAKLARKLRFLEIFFKTKFNLPQAPEEFDGKDIRHTEILFRGIIEGEFSISDDSPIIILNYKLSQVDLQSPFIPQKREFTFESDEDLLVLGKLFSIGKITCKVKKGSIANSHIFKNYETGEMIPSLRLNNFDYRVHYRFERYANSERLLKNRQKLDYFKNNLQKEEPDFLVNLLDETLAQEITEKLAIEIVEGLLQYYDFPDRFSVLKPKLEKTKWRVPIGLTYPKHELIWLADAFVDIKTGKVEMKIAFEELLKKGKKKAKEVFSIA